MWKRRIDRARELAAGNTPSSTLLATYARLLELQRDCYEALGAERTRLSGSLERDRPVLRPHVARVFEGVASIGSSSVSEDAARLLDRGESAWDEMLASAWHACVGQPFQARMIVQPYAECLAAIGLSPLDRPSGTAGRSCPFCGGVPQLAVLRSASGDEGAGRQLLCATCSTTWRTGRLTCANCGEHDERHLPYFQATELPHLRVDACDTCQRYLKSVDLTRLGTAEPVVDEVAGGALDVWAIDHGFRKIELNLLGL